jgi:hypothetical protein
MVKSTGILILVGLLLPDAGLAQSPKIVLPPTISEVEFLRGRVTDFPLPSTNQEVAGVDVQLANGKLQVRPRLAALPAGTTGPTRADFDFDVGRLLHGNYNAELLAPSSSTPLATASTTSTASDNAGIRDLSGHWWNSKEPGWGLMIWHRLKDNALFSAWFTYEAQGKPLWAVLNFDPSPALPPGSLADPDTSRAFTALLAQGSPMGGTYDSTLQRVSFLAGASTQGKFASAGIVHANVGVSGPPDYAVTGYPAPGIGFLQFVPFPDKAVRGSVAIQAFRAPASIRYPTPISDIRPNPAGPVVWPVAAGLPGAVSLNYERNYPNPAVSSIKWIWSAAAKDQKFQFRAVGKEVLTGPVICSGTCPQQPAFTRVEAETFQVPTLPAGRYAAEFFGADNTTGLPDYVASITVDPTVNPAGAPWINYSDHWWNPAEPGTGLMVWHDVASGQAFLVYFCYDTSGKAYWFSLQGGAWQAIKRGQATVFRYAGTLYESSASGYLADFFTAKDAKVIGSGSIEFTDGVNGTFAYDITGVASKTMPITRFNP